MYKFMARHLGLNLKAVMSETGAVDESDAVAPEESLKVFTAENPRPPESISGAEAASAALEKARSAAK
jgi:hypothetical protein